VASMLIALWSHERRHPQVAAGKAPPDPKDLQPNPEG